MAPGFTRPRCAAALLATLAILATGAAAQAPPGPPPPGLAGPPPPGEGGEPVGQPPGGAYLEYPLPADAPEPSPDPRGLDGVWVHKTPLEFQIRRDMFGNPLPFNEAGRKVMDRRLKAMVDGVAFINASARCLPVGIPWQMDLGMPFMILQGEDRLDLIFEEYHGAMQIFLDPAKAGEPGYMGRSLAHWDGDTLVVETTGFKEPLWLDPNGTPASRQAKLIQRIRKAKGDGWYLEVINTLDDPVYYSHPWSWARDYVWRPDLTLFREYNCELQTGRKGGIDASLVPEPQE